MSIMLYAHDWISHASNELLACQEKLAENSYIQQLKNENLENLPSTTYPIKNHNQHSKNDKNRGENLFSASAISNNEEARREASILFRHCLGIDKVQLHLKEQILVTEAQSAQLNDYLKRRMQGEPLAYIFGQKEFFGIDFFVNTHTLIPRPETEFLVEEALLYGNDKSLRILDLGCGSGCIALSILKNRTNWQAILVDISQEALATAHANAINLNLEKQAHFVLSDFCKESDSEFMHACKNISWLFDAPHVEIGETIDKNDKKNDEDKKKTISQSNPASLKKPMDAIQFDIIISNPPYIPMEEYQQLHASVKNHEPKVALLSSACQADACQADHDKNKNKGLYHIQKVIHLAEKMLKPHGLLLIEHGYNQAQDCRNLCDTTKWHSVTSGKDYSNIERYLKAFRKKN